MKLTALIILTTCLQLSARNIRAQERITLSEHNASLEAILQKVHDQTGYDYFFKVQSAKDVKVTIAVKNMTLEEALLICFQGQPFTYEIVSKIIVVKKKEETPKPAAPQLPPSAPPEIIGVVRSESGEILPGATVVIKSINAVDVTNAKGEFTLKNVPSGKYIVEISYIGYEKFYSHISVTDNTTRLTIQLRHAIGNMDETVVKGYYNTTKRLNTGNVAKVSGEDIAKQPVSDPIMALAGRVPGLFVQQTSGIPGANNSVSIRGRNSINNGLNPLYIVDGVPFSANSMTNVFIGGGAAGNPGATTPSGPAQGLSPFNNLNPADIESIEILKDADATAIYGSRGANGVIIITTKKGKAGQTKLDLNVYTGAGKVTRKLKLLNTQQYLKMRHEAFANDGLSPDVPDYDINGVWDTTHYTDWQKVLIGNSAPFTNAQVNLSGGNNNTQFAIGGGYSTQSVVYPGAYHDNKATGMITLTHSSDDQRLQAQVNLTYSRGSNNLPSIDLTSQMPLAPDAPALYDASGNLNWELSNGYNTWNNPMAFSVQTANSKSKLLISSLNLTYKILDGLQIKANLGYISNRMDQKNVSPATAVAPPFQSPQYRILNMGTTEAENWIIEPQLAYHKKISKGTLDVLLGTTFQNNSFQSSGYYVSGFTSDELIENPAAGSRVALQGIQDTKYRYSAAFGRIGYSWEDKYLINITGRRDGSSRFGPGKQFGNFGAIGAGWIFTKEGFIQNHISFLSFGKLRASYGATGNDQITDYQFLSTYTPVPVTYQGVTTLMPTQLTNPAFAWERVNKLEGGLELGFLKDRINLTVSYYRNRSGNQLVGYTLPYTTGFTTVQANLPAVVQNSGLELLLNATPIRSQNFTWSTSFNLTIPNNKLVSFPDLENSPYYYSYRVGQSLYIRQLAHSTGIDPATGYYSFKTKSPDGIPGYPDDYLVTKPITQQFYGGWQNSFSYHGLQLDVFFQFVKQRGFDYRQSFLMPGFNNFGLSNQPTYVLDHWTPDNTHAAVQKYSTTVPGLIYSGTFRVASDGPITDASFIRLKNVSLSYQLPAAWREKAHLKNARIYFLCQNLLTITSYKGLDPETGGLNLPPMRMFTGGLQLTF